MQVYELAVAIAQPQIEFGKIKLLALLNTVRTPAYPNIPTVAEAGQPALTIDGLVGLFGPPFMPMELRERIAADIKEMMESDPIIKDRLTRTAQLFDPGGPAEFGASIEAPARDGRRRRQRDRTAGQAVADRSRLGRRGGGARSSVRQPSAMVPWCWLPQCGQCTLIG